MRRLAGIIAGQLSKRLVSEARAQVPLGHSRKHMSGSEILVGSCDEMLAVWAGMRIRRYRRCGRLRRGGRYAGTDSVAGGRHPLTSSAPCIQWVPHAPPSPGDSRRRRREVLGDALGARARPVVHPAGSYRPGPQRAALVVADPGGFDGPLAPSRRRGAPRSGSAAFARQGWVPPLRPQQLIGRAEHTVPRPLWILARGLRQGSPQGRRHGGPLRPYPACRASVGERRAARTAG